MTILGISGSFRRGSHNTQLFRAAAYALPPGVELRPFDGLAAVPPYCEDADADRAPDAVEHLREQLAEADALLIATPEYNASIPGVLKNAIDWASRPSGKSSFKGKPAAGIGTSSGAIGTAVAQQHLRSILAYLNVILMGQPEAYISYKKDMIDEHGHVTDEGVRKFLQTFVDAFTTWVEKYGR